MRKSRTYQLYNVIHVKDVSRYRRHVTTCDLSMNGPCSELKWVVHLGIAPLFSPSDLSTQ